MDRLKAVIDSEPLNAARTDAEILAWLKESVTTYSDVAWSDFLLWASRYNGINRLETAKTTGTTDVIKSAAASALIVLSSGNNLNLSNSEVRGFLNNLVTEVFSAGERNDLIAFSQGSKLRYENEGFPSIDDNSWLYHIAEARL